MVVTTPVFPQILFLQLILATQLGLIPYLCFVSLIPLSSVPQTLPVLLPESILSFVPLLFICSHNIRIAH
jgi:hypothetical protein